MDIKGTIAIDSLGELARLTFAKDMKKKATDMEKLRAVNNYGGMAERINILVRKLKEFRKAGWEIVITAHEGIDRIYAKGGMIGEKGGPPPEPIAIKGRPDLPGNAGPTELMRAADNVMHVRKLGQKIIWSVQNESIGPGAGDWEVKDRFGATSLQNGFLPPSYEEIKALALADPVVRLAWNPPYIWIPYGAQGLKKTRSLLTFPKPLHYFDLDDSGKSLSAELNDPKYQITHYQYNTETDTEYDRFVVDIMSIAATPTDLAKIRLLYPAVKG